MQKFATLRPAGSKRFNGLTGDRILEEDRDAPYEFNAPIPLGTDGIWTRAFLKNRHTIDSAAREVQSSGNDDVPGMTIAIQGKERKLPHLFRYRDGTIDFTGDGEYCIQKKFAGDFTMTVKVDRLGPDDLSPHVGAAVGLTVKDMEHNAHPWRDFSVFQTKGFGVRGSPGGNDLGYSRTNKVAMAYIDHPWLRIVRSGNRFTSYFSKDGREWKKGMEWNKPMRDELFVGMLFRMNPYRSKKLLRATVSNFQIESGAKIGLPKITPVAKGMLAPNRPTGIIQSVADPKLIVVRTRGKGALLSSDRGASWRTIELNQEHDQSAGSKYVRSVAIHPAKPDIILLGTGAHDGEQLQSGLWRSADGGDTWTLVSRAIDFDGHGPSCLLGEVIAFNADQPDQVLAGGETQGLWRSNDAGLSWSPVSAPSSRATDTATNRTVLAGHRISCIGADPFHKNHRVIIGTCPDSELIGAGLGNPSVLLPGVGHGSVWYWNLHQHDRPTKVFSRADFGVNNIHVERAGAGWLLFTTMRGIYRTYTQGQTMYQVWENLYVDVPYFGICSSRKPRATVMWAVSATEGPSLFQAFPLGFQWYHSHPRVPNNYIIRAPFNPTESAANGSQLRRVNSIVLDRSREPNSYPSSIPSVGDPITLFATSDKAVLESDDNGTQWHVLLQVAD